MATHLYIFSDGSVDPKSRIGYGACIITSNINEPISELKNRVQLQRFTNTSSTQLELQALLWAIQGLSEKSDGINSTTVLHFYTDSQNIIGLPKRRQRLEANNYHSAKGKQIKHHTLYREFFTLLDSHPCEFIQVKGHQPGAQKDFISHVFTLVDQASRKALRSWASPQ